MPFSLDLKYAIIQDRSCRSHVQLFSRYVKHVDPISMPFIEQGDLNSITRGHIPIIVFEVITKEDMIPIIIRSL